MARRVQSSRGSVMSTSVPHVEPLPSAARARELERREEDFRRFYRWGWLPLFVGSVLMSGLVIAGWDLWLTWRGEDIGPKLRMVYALRAFVISVVVAAWAGFFVHRTRWRIEATREAMRAEHARLLEQRRRLEQTAGVAAILRVMAHELRNPLNGMVLHCRVLSRAVRALPDEQRAALAESVEVLDTETRRLGRLVDEYVAHGRAERVLLEPKPIDVRDAVREVAGLHRPVLDPRGIALRVETDDAPIVVDGDLEKIAQILHNLVRNAAEALKDHGTITIAAHRDGKHAVLSVGDDGPGFADVQAVFRPFYTTKSEGTGLGLAIVRDLVRAHRGEVEATNVASSGACVRIRLPLRGEPCSA